MTAPNIAVDDAPDPLAIPLNKHCHVRISSPSYAALATTAAMERTAESEVARRWMRKGALSEGVNFDWYGIR
jgi:hypothetical protein